MADSQKMDAQRKFKHVMESNSNYHSEDPQEIEAVLKLFMDMIGLPENNGSISGGDNNFLMFERWRFEIC
jgi:hypothetical protein